MEVTCAPRWFAEYRSDEANFPDRLGAFWAAVPRTCFAIPRRWATDWRFRSRSIFPNARLRELSPWVRTANSESRATGYRAVSVLWYTTCNGAFVPS